MIGRFSLNRLSLTVIILLGLLEVDVQEGRKWLYVGETVNDLLTVLDAVVNTDALVSTVQVSPSKNMLMTGD